jgi:hypothetical protein
MAQLSVLTRKFIGGTEEDHVKLPSVEVCASAWIRNSPLPNINQKRGRLNWPSQYNSGSLKNTLAVMRSSLHIQKKVKLSL